MADMIEIRGLTKRFGSRVVLDDLDAEVAGGQRLALLGLNGAGKTTLLRCAMGLLSFDGDIRVGGVDVATEGKRARDLIGYVPQRPPLFSMTLDTMVDFFATLRDVPRRHIAARLEELDLPLSQVGGLTPGELSGGMLQKALLALALAADPPLLLLDEPTANLDPPARAEFFRALRHVGRDTTVLLASHRLDEVERVAERVWIIHGAVKAFDGSLDELRERAGADSWLWIRTRGEDRRRVLDELRQRVGPDAVTANGGRVAVQLPARARLEVLTALQGSGVTIEDFWVEGPSLEEIVQGFFQGRGA